MIKINMINDFKILQNFDDLRSKMLFVCQSNWFALIWKYEINLILWVYHPLCQLGSFQLTNGHKQLQ